MKTGKSILKSRWYQIMVGILSLTALGVNLMLIKRLMGDIEDELETEAQVLHINYPALRPVMIGLLFTLIILHLVQAVVSIRESKLLFIKHLLYILLCAVAAVLVYLNGNREAVWPLACFLYLSAVFLGCLISIIQKRSKWNIFLFIFMLIVLAFAGLSVLAPNLEVADEQGLASVFSMFSIVTVFFMIDIQAVASIIPIAFSSIRMDVLKRIIKKTYAAEILSGIMLLIVAFSFIMPAFEPGIKNFGDSLWYCFAIVTTIGFGDITAVSAIGRVMSVILGLYGIIVVSLITSIIVNFYGEMKREEPDDGAPSDNEADGNKGEGEDPSDRSAGENAAVEEVQL